VSGCAPPSAESTAGHCSSPNFPAHQVSSALPSHYPHTRREGERNLRAEQSHTLCARHKKEKRISTSLPHDLSSPVFIHPGRQTRDTAAAPPSLPSLPSRDSPKEIRAAERGPIQDEWGTHVHSFLGLLRRFLRTGQVSQHSVGGATHTKREYGSFHGGISKCYGGGNDILDVCVGHTCGCDRLNNGDGEVCRQV